ncbi:hypothetical protein ACFXKD_04255 [Nocardiopsis aegyptia]|uniref:hypothetical protein n=1 Tax=Nocardiopsis aegyptia TaxID=220378 RepID=UPI003672C6FF
MADVWWDDVKDLFDPGTMGALPDARVPDTSGRDWQALLDLIVERGWRHRYTVGETAAPLPRAQDILSRSGSAEIPQLRVWPTDGVEMIFRFHTPEEIDFDLDLRQLQGQDGVDLLCGFFGAIGRRLGKPVLMDPEGDHGHPVLGFDVHADRVVRLVDPM